MQAGLNAAASADQVWVAKGLYVETITLKAGVGLYGGFAGTEDELAGRLPFPRQMPDENETVLDANRTDSVVTVLPGATESTLVDGFTIKNGWAIYGGGIYCSGASPIVCNNTVTGNNASSGGGISCLNASPRITGNVINGNTAQSAGGIECRESSPAIIGNTITANNATFSDGGGVYLSYCSSPTLTNNIITENTCRFNGGGVFCYVSPATMSQNSIASNWASVGAGIYIDNSSATISSNAITNNHSSGYGGGIYCRAAAPIVRNNSVIGNSANTSGAGGIQCETSSATVSDNVISENIPAGVSSGSFGEAAPVISHNFIAKNDNGVTVYVGSASISHNVISENVHEGVIVANGGPSVDGNLIRDNMEGINSQGSATLLNNVICANKSAGINCNQGGYPTIVNNTIAYNEVGIDCMHSTSPRISNSIVVFNTRGIRSTSSKSVVLSRNDVYGNPAANYVGLPAGSIDISANPLFLAPWVGDYHLRPSSPCIDTGNDSAVRSGWTDFDGKPRILGLAVDMGCFEWDSTAYWIRSIGQARAVPEGFAIELRGKPVTAGFGNAFYIEEPDRSAGLRILSSQTVNPGDLATVDGQLVVDGGERALQPSSVFRTAGSPANIPKQLGMPNRSLGGGDYFYSASPDAHGQPGITSASGLNNIGLLVKIVGKPTQIDPLKQYFYIDDGSNLRDGTTTASEDNIGVRVAFDGSSLDTTKTYAITGISSCFKGTDGKLRRLLRVVDAADIQPLSAP